MVMPINGDMMRAASKRQWLIRPARLESLMSIPLNEQRII